MKLLHESMKLHAWLFGNGNWRRGQAPWLRIYHPGVIVTQYNLFSLFFITLTCWKIIFKVNTEASKLTPLNSRSDSDVCKFEKLQLNLSINERNPLKWFDRETFASMLRVKRSRRKTLKSRKSKSLVIPSWKETICRTEVFQLFLLEILCSTMYLQCDIWLPHVIWPPPKIVVIVNSMGHPPAAYKISQSHLHTRFSNFDIFWPQLTFEPHQKDWIIEYNMGVSHNNYESEIHQVYPLWSIVNKLFTIWPLETPNELSPPPKTEGFL